MHQPFKNLKKKLKPAKEKKKLEQKKKDADSVSEKVEKYPDEDDDFHFSKAMHGVAPLKRSGRQVPQAPMSSGKPGNTLKNSSDRLKEIVAGQVEFDLRFSHEYMEGAVCGLDDRIFRKLKNGGYSIQGHIDLHGMNIRQAQLALEQFVRSAYMDGHKCVQVITGRGKNSPQGRGVLRQELSEWLIRQPFKRVVLAFCTALPRHGGTGAIYLLLRSIRKNQGKVVWENLFVDIDG